MSAVKLYLKPPQKGGYIKYYSARLKKIILPYIAAVAVFYCYFAIRGYFPFRAADLVGYILSGELVSHFYFVIIIAQFYLLKPLWDFTVRKTQNKIGAQIAIFALSLALSVLCSRYLPYALSRISGRDFIYNDRVFTTYLVYWAGGMFVGANYEAFAALIRKKRRIFYALYPIFAVFEVYFAIKSAPCAEYVHFAYCLIAILFWLLLGTRIANGCMQNRLLKKINNASYYIYLIHPLFIFESDRIAAAIGISSVTEAFLMRAAITYILSISVSCGYLKIKRRGKLC